MLARQMRMLLGLGLTILGACGPELATQKVAPLLSLPAPPPVRAGVPPPGDEVSLRKVLAGEVANGGLWFADATCETQFGTPGTIAPAAFDAFAHCLAGLHLRPSGRGDAHDDTSVLTDDMGFEIEARVAGGRLDFIGFSARAPGAPDLPTITPQTLEGLRFGGEPNATLAPSVASQLIPANDPHQERTEHLRLCLADSGRVATIGPATTTTPMSVAAFASIARDWTFRPFVAGGKPMAACAVVAFHYPASHGAEVDQLPRPPEVSKAGHFVYNVSPLQLQPYRVAGNVMITPDDEDKAQLFHTRGVRVVGSFKLCVDETGHYESGTLLKSTGLPRYDARIVRTMMTTWVYRPYVVDGVAVPVCSAITFIYTQR